MNELERRIEILEHQLKEKQVELNIVEDLYLDEIKDYKFYNGLLVALVLSMALWVATG